MSELKSYRELLKIDSFQERLEYLKLKGNVGEETFGSKRYINQRFYNSAEWKQIRNQVIIRDNGCDLGFPNCEISGAIYIHHINPLSPDNFLDYDDFLSKYNSLDNLICCSANTHNAIHYGMDVEQRYDPIERKPNDTIPWK